MSDELEGPIWTAPEVFPAKPTTSPFGALSRKEARTEFDSLEALQAHVRDSRESLLAVWVPEEERMVPPEAVPALLEALRKRFVDSADIDWFEARRSSLVFGGLLLWAVYATYSRGLPLAASQNAGLAALLLLILGLIPLYEAWKARRSAWALTEQSLQEEAREARFEHWMDGQSLRVTYGLLVLLLMVGVAQIWVGPVSDAVDAAGLRKQEGDASWRYFTAPFLHGNLLHFGLNASGLWYLGRRSEALMGWPHLLLGFLVAMIAGGVATEAFVPGTSSIGASGGLLGVLGMLLAFELLHPRLVPNSARRRLVAGVLATFAIGLVGYQFIDNAAHAGGLAAGIIYSLIVFPKSRSARRPKANRTDRVVGGLAGVVLTASALWAFWQMVIS